MYYVADIHSVEDFARVKNNSGADRRQVCFARALGAGRDDILRLDGIMLQNMRAGSVLYNRIRALPAAPAAQDVEYYSGCYRNWTDCQKGRMHTRASGDDAELSGLLGRAVSEITDKYRQIKPGMSETIERNFVVKLLYWFDVVIQELTAHRVCAQGDGEENIKLAVHAANPLTQPPAVMLSGFPPVKNQAPRHPRSSRAQIPWTVRSAAGSAQYPTCFAAAGHLHRQA